MRVESKIGVGTPAPAARRGASSTFSLKEGGQSRPAGAAGAVVDLGGIDALLLLQGEDDAGQRRKRQARRGRDLLDGLDRLKAALLGGRVPLGDLDRLRTSLALRREETGDAVLDEVLAQIEIRAEVELAKLEPRKS
jgi:hypothetical protein